MRHHNYSSHSDLDSAGIMYVCECQHAMFRGKLQAKNNILCVIRGLCFNLSHVLALSLNSKARKLPNSSNSTIKYLNEENGYLIPQMDRPIGRYRYYFFPHKNHQKMY